MPKYYKKVHFGFRKVRDIYVFLNIFLYLKNT